MSDKIDLSGVERKLEEISRNLHKPFEDMDNRQRHKDMLEAQNKQHKEILESQNKFYEKTLSQQSELNKWTRYLAVATIILSIATIFLSIFTIVMAYNTKLSIDLQTDLYSPKITAQITDKKLPWSEYAESYNHRVPQNFWNATIYSIPIYVEINNNGIVPFQLYNIEFESNCGIGNKGLLSFPDNISKVIGIGETIAFNSNTGFGFNTTVQEGLPCEINFVIYGNNLIRNKKIILIKDT